MVEWSLYFHSNQLSLLYHLLYFGVPNKLDISDLNRNISNRKQNKKDTKIMQIY